MTNTSNAGHAGIDIDKVLENLAEGVDYGTSLEGGNDMQMKDTEDLVLVSRAWCDRRIDMFEASQKPRTCKHCGDAFGSSDGLATVCHECEEAVKYGQ